jgi:transcriptional regulator with XRE-family HTH domain
MDLGITQKHAGRRIGVSQWTVINWEKGRTEPAVRFVPRILQLLCHDPRCQASSFAELLRQARLGRGLSQQRLAQVLRVDEGTIRGWERGRHRPSRRLLRRVARLLGLLV